MGLLANKVLLTICLTHPRGVMTIVNIQSLMAQIMSYSLDTLEFDDI